MSTVYGYTRVSTTAQAERGLSLDAQRTQIDVYVTALIAKDPTLNRGKIYRDEGVSASKRPFLGRPAGHDLCYRVVAGDHIVIAKLDRGFRSTSDCLATLKRWSRKKITVHLLDLNVDTSTPMGQLLTGILAVIAEWESARRGERIRDAFVVKRQAAPGKSLTGVRVLGYRLDERGMLLPHHEERTTGKLASDLRSQGLSWPEVVAALRSRGYLRPASPRGNALQRQSLPYTKDMLRLLIKRHRCNWPMHPRVNDSVG